MESTALHVHVPHGVGYRWKRPKREQQLICYDHANERTCRHFNSCQSQKLVYARIPLVNRPQRGEIHAAAPRAEPHGRFTILVERFVIGVLGASQTTKRACRLLCIG
jgi:hypothetical protein